VRKLRRVAGRNGSSPFHDEVLGGFDARLVRPQHHVESGGTVLAVQIDLGDWFRVDETGRAAIVEQHEQVVPQCR